MASRAGGGRLAATPREGRPPRHLGDAGERPDFLLTGHSVRHRANIDSAQRTGPREGFIDDIAVAQGAGGQASVAQIVRSSISEIGVGRSQDRDSSTQAYLSSRRPQHDGGLASRPHSPGPIGGARPSRRRGIAMSPYGESWGGETWHLAVRSRVRRSWGARRGASGGQSTKEPGAAARVWHSTERSSTGGEVQTDPR